MTNQSQSIILVATQNRDKFQIVADILKGIGAVSYQYLSLNDLRITEDMEESGSTEDRATQKVLFYQKLIENNDIYQNVVAIVGVDDGIFIKKEGYHTADSKNIVDQILSGTRIDVGDEIVVRRSFFVLNPHTHKSLLCTTGVPFQFLGNPKGITRQSGKYPLSHVIGHLDQSVPVVENSDENNTEYYVRYSQELLPVLEML